MTETVGNRVLGVGLRVVTIVQARMGSTRLPGKVLREVDGKPLLEYLLERLARATQSDAVWVATTTRPGDEPIVEVCSRLNVEVFRGSETDVLERYFLAAQACGADAVVRVTSDCPLIDPGVLDELIGYYREHSGDYDYVSNAMERSYPLGMEAEVFSMAALKRAHESARDPEEREHVTVYMKRHPEQFRLGGVSGTETHKDHRWTVDTPEDLELVAGVIGDLYPSKPDFTIRDILELFERHPERKTINSHIRQKEVGEQGP